MPNRKIAKIIREDYPSSYKGYEFITLIQYNEERYLSIVDRVTDKTISAYLLDLCGPAKIDEEVILNIAYDWSISERHNIPISYEFAKLGITDSVANIYKVFNIDFVERVIGPLPEIKSVKTVIKRKKRKYISKNTQINFK